MASRVALLLASAAAVASAAYAPAAPAWGPPCSEETACLATPATPRCLPSASSGVGAPCTLDYEFNETSLCSCGAQACTPLPPGNASDPSKLQLLMIGDSISLGLQPFLAAALNATHEVVHAPGNCGNAHWGVLCQSAWLGADPHRWDVVTVNHGLHDLAYPDNEHIALPNYAGLVAQELASLKAALRPGAAVVWMRTTPVPTSPPPECVLIPRRVQADVDAYNAAADAVAAGAGVPTCNLEGVVQGFCGVGYSNCSITQCGGPHFTPAGFALLGAAAAACVVGV